MAGGLAIISQRDNQECTTAGTEIPLWWLLHCQHHHDLIIGLPGDNDSHDLRIHRPCDSKNAKVNLNSLEASRNDLNQAETNLLELMLSGV